MENRTRFNLNTAIENWRNELAAQPNLTSDDRRELETHLRDAITEFEQRGLKDEESFWLARRRVGQPQVLGEEFVKVNPSGVWRERIFWLALGVISWQLTLILANVAKIILNFLIPGLHGFYQKSGFWFADVAILIIGIILAREWFVRYIRPIWFLENRFRLVISVMSLIILMASTQTGIVRQDYLNRGYDSAVRLGLEPWFERFLHLTLGYLEYCVAPLIILILFFPPQHKTSKCA